MNQKRTIVPKSLTALIIAVMSVHMAAAFDEPVPSADTAVTNIFTDIEYGHRHYVAIKYLKENGLIEGYEDGSFRPLNEINRAEALKILTGALGAVQPADEKDSDSAEAAEDGTPEINQSADNETDTSTSADIELPFPDVPREAWFYSYVLAAFKNNVVNGYPDGLFHPENTINRVESLKIALLLEGEEIPEQIAEPPYFDVPVDAWFAPYAQISSERSLIIRSRENDSLYPDQNMNRGDFADLVYRLIKSQNGNRFAVTTWYGFEDVDWGTASGEKFDTNLPTAAHKTLPFGTYLKVTNLANGKSIVVKINDRGPYARGMDLDLTSSAFEAIASLGAGVIVTEYEITESPEGETVIAEESINNEPSDEIQYGF